jgi:hypothetical protein
MDEENVIKFPNSRDQIPDLMDVPVGNPEDTLAPVQTVYEGLTNILPTLETLIVIAQDNEGRFFFASSDLKKSNILYDLKTAEYSLMA